MFENTNKSSFLVQLRFLDFVLVPPPSLEMTLRRKTGLLLTFLLANQARINKTPKEKLLKLCA